MSDEKEPIEEIRQQLTFLHARELASMGDVDEAIRELETITDLKNNVSALDLLARIKQQAGDDKSARDIWEKIKLADPTNEAAKNALNAMNRPWRIFYLVKRIGIWTFALISLCLALYTWQTRPTSTIDGGPQTTHGNSLVIKDTNLALISVQPNEVTIGGNAAVDQGSMNETGSVPPDISSDPLVELSATGWSRMTNGGEVIYVPESPIFTYRSELSPNADKYVKSLAQSIEAVATNVVIVIRGHTDSDPLPVNSQYQDNEELQLQRAISFGKRFATFNTVQERNVYLQAQRGNSLLYQEDTPENKARNRTVSITLKYLDGQPQENINEH